MKDKIMLLILLFLFSIIGITGCIIEESQREGEPQYEIYENNDIAACGVNDPLQNIEWLKEYCNNIKEKKDISYVYIWLYEVIDKDEHIFEISVFHQLFEGSVSKKYLNCNGDIILEKGTTAYFSQSPMRSEVPPPPDPWFADKEFICELFHFVKQ